MANALVATGQGSPDNAANYPYTFSAADVNDRVSTPSTGASAAAAVATDTVSRDSVITPHATVGCIAGHVLLVHELQLSNDSLLAVRSLSVIGLLWVSAPAKFVAPPSQTAIQEPPALLQHHSWRLLECRWLSFSLRHLQTLQHPTKHQHHHLYGQQLSDSLYLQQHVPQAPRPPQSSLGVAAGQLWVSLACILPWSFPIPCCTAHVLSDAPSTEHATQLQATVAPLPFMLCIALTTQCCSWSGHIRIRTPQTPISLWAITQSWHASTTSILTHLPPCISHRSHSVLATPWALVGKAGFSQVRCGRAYA